MKKKTKFYISMSAVITSAMPIAIVLSCGSQNNNYQHNNLDKNNGDLNAPSVYTKDFFKNVQETLEFSGAQGSVTPVDNETLNVGIPYATLKYGWSLDDVKEPSVYVADYHQVKSMNYGYTFWIVVTPKDGIPMGEGQSTTLKTKAYSSWVDSSKIAKKAVETDDFFSSVKSTMTFYTETNQSIATDDNPTLNGGLANATLKYGWSYNPLSKPVQYVTDYHQINDMQEGYTFWVIVTPKDGIPMGDGQKSALKITVVSSGSKVVPSKEAVETDDFFSSVKSTMTFHKWTIGIGTYVATDDNATLNGGLANATLEYGWSIDGTKPHSFVSNYHQLNNMQDGYTFWILVIPNVGVPMGDGQQTALSINVVSSGYEHIN